MIIDLQKKLHEAGRIRIGEQVRTSNGKTRPSKLETFRFTSPNEDAINAIAGIHGGIPSKWEDAPTGKQWEVTTESNQVRVLVPPESMAFSQFYELWSGNGCQRRCDGAHLIPSDEPCLCDPDNRECKAHTRVSVMLADCPTSGLWRLDTQGYYAAVELSGGFEMATLIAKASGRTMLTGVLRLEQREVKRPGQQTKKFAVPVIDFDIDVSAFVVGQRQIATTVAPPLNPSVTPIPRDDAPVPSVGEQLHAVEVPAEPRPRANAATPLPATGVAPRTSAEISAQTSAKPPSTPSMRRLFAILGGKGIKGDDERHKWASDVLGRNVETFSELSQSDVTKLNDAAEGNVPPVMDEPRYTPEEEPF